MNLLIERILLCIIALKSGNIWEVLLILKHLSMIKVLVLQQTIKLLENDLGLFMQECN